MLRQILFDRLCFFFFFPSPALAILFHFPSTIVLRFRLMHSARLFTFGREEELVDMGLLERHPLFFFFFFSASHFALSFQVLYLTFLPFLLGTHISTVICDGVFLFYLFIFCFPLIWFVWRGILCTAERAHWQV